MTLARAGLVSSPLPGTGVFVALLIILPAALSLRTKRPRDLAGTKDGLY